MLGCRLFASYHEHSKLSKTLTLTSHSEFNVNFVGPGVGVASDAPASKKTVNNSREIADCTLLSSTASGTRSTLGFSPFVALCLEDRVVQ